MMFGGGHQLRHRQRKEFGARLLFVDFVERMPDLVVFLDGILDLLLSFGDVCVRVYGLTTVSVFEYLRAV